jgi:hypothetical protein
MRASDGVFSEALAYGDSPTWSPDGHNMIYRTEYCLVSGTCTYLARMHRDGPYTAHNPLLTSQAAGPAWRR